MTKGVISIFYVLHVSKVHIFKEKKNLFSLFLNCLENKSVFPSYCSPCSHFPCMLFFRLPIGSVSSSSTRQRSTPLNPYILNFFFFASSDKVSIFLVDLRNLMGKMWLFFVAIVCGTYLVLILFLEHNMIIFCGFSSYFIYLFMILWIWIMFCYEIWVQIASCG